MVKSDFGNMSVISEFRFGNGLKGHKYRKISNLKIPPKNNAFSTVRKWKVLKKKNDYNSSLITFIWK